MSLERLVDCVISGGLAMGGRGGGLGDEWWEAERGFGVSMQKKKGGLGLGLDRCIVAIVSQPSFVCFQSAGVPNQKLRGRDCCWMR